MGDPLFRIGQQVRRKSARDQIGIVTGSPKLLGGENWYPIFFGGFRALNVPATDLEPHEGGREPEDLLVEASYGNKNTLSRLITFTKLQSPLRDNLYAVRSTRTLLLPYQFKPLLKFLESDRQRLLIADEVGLGKTIEAGLILTELKARHPGSLDRILVACPSALRDKWRNELKSRFNEDFRILDTSGIRQFLRDFERDGESAKLRGICSLQTLRGRQLMEEWEALSPPLDLLIVDEAHHLRNPDTLSHRMGRGLGENADGMLLLTATPIQLGNANLFYLLRTLDPEKFGSNPETLEDPVGERLFEDLVRANEPIVRALRLVRTGLPQDLEESLSLLRGVAKGPQKERFLSHPSYAQVIRKLEQKDRPTRARSIELQREISRLNLLSSILTRTRKAETQSRIRRVAHLIPVEWTKEEQGVYDAVTDYVLANYQLHRGDPFAMFLVMMPQRQIASCIPAVVHRYEKELRFATGGRDDELSDLDKEDWVEEEDMQESDRLDLDLREVIRLWHSAGSPDSKCQALLTALRKMDETEPSRKVLVFAYFKPTLYYLEEQLRIAGYPTRVITGDVPNDEPERERSTRIEEFENDPSVRILLSSEVGSEGLDFQRACNTLINYDLPWNPMTVEQRIGRLDRIGQPSEKVLIFNFSIPGTIEERILTRLYSRIRIFEQSIGELEPIIGEQIRELTNELLSSRLTPREQEERIEHAAELLELRKQESAELEAASAHFLGQEEFFSEEMSRILKKKRYVSAEEVKLFLQEFLSNRHPNCTLEGKGNNQYQLTVSEELLGFVRQHFPSDDPRLQDFLRRCLRNVLRLTFDSDVALNNHDVDFVNVHHPLVGAIVDHYRQSSGELHPVARIRLSGFGDVKGEFFYFIYRLVVHGARDEYSLEPVFVSARDKQVLDADSSEDLVGAMVTEGTTLESVPEHTTGRIREIQEVAEQEFDQRVKRLKNELMSANEAIVRSRLISLQQSYQARISKKEQQLEGARRKGSPGHYIRLLEGTLRRLRLDYDNRCREIEKGRQLNFAFDQIGSGFLRVD